MFMSVDFSIERFKKGLKPLPKLTKEQIEF